MVAKYVGIFKCFKCGRIYLEKHGNKLNNIYPLVPDNYRCTYINNFHDRFKHKDFPIEFCDNKLQYLGKLLISGHREYFEKDECLEYYTKRSMKELCS